MVRKIAVNLLVAGAAVGLGLWASVKPWRLNRQASAERDRQLRDTRTLEQKRMHDQELTARYGSTEGREELARKQGFRKPGEAPIQP